MQLPNVSGSPQMIVHRNPGKPDKTTMEDLNISDSQGALTQADKELLLRVSEAGGDWRKLFLQVSSDRQGVIPAGSEVTKSYLLDTLKRYSGDKELVEAVNIAMKHLDDLPGGNSKVDHRA